MIKAEKRRGPGEGRILSWIRNQSQGGEQRESVLNGGV